MVKPGDTPDESFKAGPVWFAWRTGDFEWWVKSDKANFEFEWHNCRHTADRGEGELYARVMLVVTAWHDNEHFDSAFTFKHVTAGQGETGILNRHSTVRSIPTSDEGLLFDLRRTFHRRHLLRS